MTKKKKNSPSGASDKGGFSFIDWDVTPTIEAIYVGQLRGIGAWNKNVFSFRDKQGERLESWSYVNLASHLRDVPFGTALRIEFLGTEPMPNNPKNKFKNFSVTVIEDFA